MLYLHNSQQFGGCEAYRMTLPADTLRQQRGVCVDYAHAKTVEQFVQDGQIQMVLAYDIYVLPRAAFQMPSMADKLHRLGKRLVVEVDDDFTGEHRLVFQEPEYSAFWHGVSLCDAVLTSTPHLGEVMRKRTGKPTFVCPNSVPIDLWAKVPKAKELTIGLTGSPTHKEDWAVLADVLPEILAAYPHVHLLLAGYCPPYFENLVRNAPQQVRFVPWLSFAEYPAIAGSVHITLCPVDPHDGFNHSKSGIKAIEGLAAGAAVIATDMTIYREVLTSGKQGLLVDYTPDAWREALVSVIENAGLRKRLGQAGHKHAVQKHNIVLNAGRWWDAFTQIARLS